MLFRSISFNSTKSFEADVEVLCKKNGPKQTIGTVNPRPWAPIIIGCFGFDADELYNEKLFDNLANKAREV